MTLKKEKVLIRDGAPDSAIIQTFTVVILAPSAVLLRI